MLLQGLPAITGSSHSFSIIVIMFALQGDEQKAVSGILLDYSFEVIEIAYVSKQLMMTLV